MSKTLKALFALLIALSRFGAYGGAPQAQNSVPYATTTADASSGADADTPTRPRRVGKIVRVERPQFGAVTAIQVHWSATDRPTMCVQISQACAALLVVDEITPETLRRSIELGNAARRGFEKDYDSDFGEFRDLPCSEQVGWLISEYSLHESAAWLSLPAGDAGYTPSCSRLEEAEILDLP